MSASFLHHNIFVIIVLPRVWRPKSPIKYIPLSPHPDNQRENYLHTRFGYAIERVSSLPSALRNDIITWKFTAHSKEIQDNIKIDKGIPSNIRKKVISSIQHYWDAFDEDGVSRPVIDTGASSPVYCRLPRYGIHKAKIMDKQIKTLEDNNWIVDCNGTWGSIILLAPKPRQEDINNIDDFV